MLTLEQLRNPSDVELSRFDLAAIDLACDVGLPGSERLNIPACLAWVDHATAWVRHQTATTIDQFRHKPETYENSEGIFRVVAIMNVLWRGLGVHYNREWIANPEEFSDSRDDFIHGIIEGRGGTCASLPILITAVGRRLGYPLNLVKTSGHLFARWDDPNGERFNVEINDTGLNTHPDEYYLTWPFDIRRTNWSTETKFLRSFTPRDELAKVWSKRGHLLRSNCRLKEAVDCFATACSITTDDRLLDAWLWKTLKERRETIEPKIPTETPKLKIVFPDRRRYPGIPIEVERDIMALEVVETLLNEPVIGVEQVVRCILS